MMILPDNTFLITAFWKEALACIGEIDEAFEHLENLITYSNHLGLLVKTSLSMEANGKTSLKHIAMWD